MIVEFETPVRGKSTTAAMTTVNSAWNLKQHIIYTWTRVLRNTIRRMKTTVMCSGETDGIVFDDLLQILSGFLTLMKFTKLAFPQLLSKTRSLYVSGYFSVWHCLLK